MDFKKLEILINEELGNIIDNDLNKTLSELNSIKSNESAN